MTATSSVTTVSLVASADAPPGDVVVENEDGTTTRLPDLEAVEALFGRGSWVWLWASRHFLPAPPPPTCAFCSAVIGMADGNACAPCRARRDLFGRVYAGFYAVARCIELVEAHATALFEADGSGAFTLSEWRELAFQSVGLLFGRSPELLPFGDGEDES